MKKEFQKWHIIKSEADSLNRRLFYHEREVWWCLLGVNVGFEMDGKGHKYTRPVLVLKGFSKEVCLCLPLTTRQKKGKFYCDIDLDDGTARQVILSQIRLIDTKRLLEKLGTINVANFKQIKQALIRLIE